MLSRPLGEGKRNREKACELRLFPILGESLKMGNKDLDLVLEYFYNQKDRLSKTRDVCLSVFKSIGSIDITNTEAIIDKLQRDGLLKSMVEGYKITFDGRIFHEMGGYTEKVRKESTSTSLQSWQTWAIAVGTILGGLYGLVEILKYIFSLKC